MMRDENVAINTQFWRIYLYKKKGPRYHAKKIAEVLGFTTVYICDIEKSRRYPPTKGDMLSKAAILRLDDDDLSVFYDLAGRDKGCVSPDLSEYIMSSEIIRSALRTAKGKATAKDWQRFIDSLDK